MARVVAYLSGLFFAALVASNLATFVELDGCMDAGGRFIASTGACVTPLGSQYVPVLSRPENYGFWAAFVLLLFAAGFLAFKAVEYIIKRLTRRSTRTPSGAG